MIGSVHVRWRFPASWFGTSLRDALAHDDDALGIPASPREISAATSEPNAAKNPDETGGIGTRSFRRSSRLPLTAN